MKSAAPVLDELLIDFVAETRESLEQIAAQLIAWEQAPDDPEHLEAVFRFVHTVKGSCGFLDLPRIASLAHAAETVLSAIRDGLRGIDRRTTSGLLALIDRIGVLTDAIESGTEPHFVTDDEVLIAALDETAAEERLDAGAAAAGTDAARATNRTVRVGVDRLEALMAQVSDLVLARNELAHVLPSGDQDATLGNAFTRLSFVLGEVRETVARTRMQPIERLFASVPRLVRDTAAALAKDVRVEIEGGDVEIDREMVEAIRDPLVHVIRNAIDHGIEAPAARKAAGKPLQGVIRIVAHQAGNQVSIRVSDDGRGIDTGRLLAKAIAAQVVDAAEAQQLTQAEILQLIFAPGLSTADEVTQVSGRGVGMDVVRANVLRLGGALDLDNRPGSGFGLTLRVPLTLSIMSVLVVEAGGLAFALPRSAVDEIVQVNSPSLRLEAIGTARIALLRGQMLSALDLADQLGIDGGKREHLVVLAAADGGRFALAVDRVVDHVDLVVRPVAAVLGECGIYSGQSLSEDGSPLLLLDAAAIGKAAGIEGAARLPEALLERHRPDMVQLLLFVGLDGVSRAVPAAAVERIGEVPIDAVVSCGAESFAAVGGEVIPLLVDGNLPAEGGTTVVYLKDDARTVAYAVKGVRDLTSVNGINPAGDSRRIAGIALIEGVPVEVLAWPRVARPPRRARAVAA